MNEWNHPPLLCSHPTPQYVFMLCNFCVSVNLSINILFLLQLPLLAYYFRYCYSIFFLSINVIKWRIIIIISIQILKEWIRYSEFFFVFYYTFFSIRIIYMIKFDDTPSLSLIVENFLNARISDKLTIADWSRFRSFWTARSDHFAISGSSFFRAFEIVKKKQKNPIIIIII